MRVFIIVWIIILFCHVLLTPLHLSGQITGKQLNTVVIDPGHGGYDPGAVAGGVKEKELVLSVALRLGNKIKYIYPDIKVIYTRSKDVFIPLHERASIALRNKADLFISIHANYVSETFVSGTETFTLGLHRTQENLDVAKKENSVILLEDDYSTRYQGFNPKETESYIMFENMQSEYQFQSIDFAARIQDEFTRNLRLTNRGVKQAGFLVLRETSMPSVLIEIGFISNPAERKFLITDDGKESVAESIFRAFSEYKRMIDLKSRFDLASSGDTDIAVQENRSDSLLSNAGQSQKKPDVTRISPAKDSITAKTPEKKISQPDATPTSPGTTKSPISVSEPPKAESQKAESGNQTWFSVQIGATAKEIDPSPQNFKNEKAVYMVKVTSWYKYYSGRFGNFEEALAEKTRLNSKFSGAFVVIFENGLPRPYVKK